MDRFYTNRELLKEIGVLTAAVVPESYTFVDFSCGDNYFCRECLPGINTLSYDLMPKEDHSIIRADWLKVEQLPANIVIGLNPPFGYQGATAKLFVKKALSFAPHALVLILPLVKFDVPAYEITYEKVLPKNAFIDPDTHKPFPEIGAKLVIYKKGSVPSSITTKKNPRKATHGITVSRKWKTEWTSCLIVRRVGRSTTKQFYIVPTPQEYHFIDFAANTCQRVPQPTHKVYGDCWLKVYFASDVSYERLHSIAEYIFANPEPGYEFHHPHAITNGFVIGAISAVLQ